MQTTAAEPPPLPPKAAVCGGCHGSGSAAPPPGMPLLAGQQAEFLVLQMFLMREGLRIVPEMKGLLDGWSDAELEAAAAHFSAQKLAAPRPARNEKLYARGEQLSQSSGCNSCHLGNYSGQRQVPRLAGQREDYLALAMKAYRDNKRVGADTQMNGIMRGVADADIGALAHFLSQRQLTP